MEAWTYANLWEAVAAAAPSRTALVQGRRQVSYGAFDRRANVGLHHLALKVADRAALAAAHDRVRAHPGTAIAFAPGPMREGSETHHFLCTMPGGVRLEFATA